MYPKDYDYIPVVIEYLRRYTQGPVDTMSIRAIKFMARKGGLREKYEEMKKRLETC